DGIRAFHVTGVQTCALPIYPPRPTSPFHPRRTVLAVLAAVPLLASAPAARELSFGGEGWTQFGRMVRSSDTSSFDYSGEFMRATAAQLSLRGRLSDRLEIGAGLGAVERHFPTGSVSNNGGRHPLVLTPYITEARFTYAPDVSAFDGESALSLTGGFFHHNYHPDVKNLGLY